MISSLYRGSVKDVLGPVSFLKKGAGDRVDGVIFKYTDAYSIFDWGRMPNELPGKGAALAVLAAEWFTRLEAPESWREFSKSPEAMALRKAAPKTGAGFGATLNEIGEALQNSGLRTHFLGVLADPPSEHASECVPLSFRDQQNPFKYLAVRKVSVVKPQHAQVLGRSLLDYQPTRSAPLPRLIPLEVVFRFGCPAGNSLVQRAKENPHYLSTLPFVRSSEEWGLEGNPRWDFPLVELFTKLESTDRPLSVNEAVAISGVAPGAFQEMVLKSVWVAGWLKHQCAKSGIELADGKLEWALDADGTCFLVDAIGPDELRLLKNGVQLSKEFFREHYRKTPWYTAVVESKREAETRGAQDWKRGVSESPPTLSAATAQWGGWLYQSLTNALTGHTWFEKAPSLEQVLATVPGTA